MSGPPDRQCPPSAGRGHVFPCVQVPALQTPSLLPSSQLRVPCEWPVLLLTGTRVQEESPLTYTLEVMQGPALLALQTVGFLRSCASGTRAKACWAESRQCQDRQAGAWAIPAPRRSAWLPTRTYQVGAVARCLEVAQAALATGLAPVAGLAVTAPAAPSSPFPFTLPVATARPFCAPRTCCGQTAAG